MNVSRDLAFLRTADFAARILLFGFICLVVARYFSPLHPTFIDFGLDPSWRFGLVEARKLGLAFGREVIFSGGPLSHVYSRSYDPSLVFEKFGAAAIYIGFFVAFFQTILSKAGIPAACIAVIPVLFNVYDDPIMLGIPFSAALILTTALSWPRTANILILGALASAIATLSKFSTFPVAFLCFALADVVALSRRRVPFALMTYLLCLLLIFHAVSPSGASLWTFIGASADFSSGYAYGASVGGPLADVTLMLIAVFGFLALVVIHALKDLRGGASVVAVTCRVLMVALYLFVCVKGGFVRYPGHWPIVLYGLAFAAAVYGALVWTTAGPRWNVALSGVALGALAWGQIWLVGEIGISHRQVVSDILYRPYQGLADWSSFLSRPRQWMAAQLAQHLAALQRLRAQMVLPKLDGTVDTIPSIQSSLIANGLQYRPRPSVQDYATFTSALIEKNRAYFAGSTAPEFLFMAPSGFDNHHPASAEGPLWPLLLGRYVPHDLISGMALLRRRSQTIDVPLQVYRTEKTSWDKPVTLEPARQGAVFATIDVRPNLAGRLADLAFKSAPVHLRVHYTDGSEAEYRVVTAIARAGFFISPLIDSATDYVSLASGRAASLPLKVQSFGVRTSGVGRWLYSDEIAVTLAALDDTHLADAAEDLAPNGRSVLELERILRRNPPSPTVGMIGERLSVHAPSRLRVEAAGKTKLDVSFGLFDGSWQGDGNTGGACLRVGAAESPVPLWERCLDPKTVVADRGPQSAEIALPGRFEELVLETTCRTDCGWAWSYWGRVSLR